MALAEFLAIETAYRALVQLDQSARARALGWLTDALGAPGELPTAADLASTEQIAQIAAQAASPGAVVSQPSRRTRRAARTTPQATAVTRRSAREAGNVGSRSRGRIAKTTEPTDTATTESGRAYRRMPPADQVMAAYQQIGTVTGLAEHFDVPRHTVSGWARRLRNEGHNIGRSG
jgi:hypothetical protein